MSRGITKQWLSMVLNGHAESARLCGAIDQFIAEQLPATEAAAG